MRLPLLSDSFFYRLEVLLLAIWCGALFVTGFLVVPTLFTLLDRITAGQVAATLFTYVSLIGLLCGAVLIPIMLYRPGSRSLDSSRWLRIRPVILILILLLVVAGEFGISAGMREMRDKSPRTAGTQPEFRRLHRIASSFYLLESVGGLFLLLTIPASPRRAAGQGGHHDRD